jgi:hypothetical protein
MLDSQCSESERIAQLQEPAFLDSQCIAQMTAMTGCKKKTKLLRCQYLYVCTEASKLSTVCCSNERCTRLLNIVA